MPDVISSDQAEKPAVVELKQANGPGPATVSKTRSATPDSATSSPVKVLATATPPSTPVPVAAGPSSTSNSPKHQPLPTLKNLLDHGLDGRLAARLEKLFTSTKLSMSDLDDRAVEALKEFGNVDGAICVLNEFEESNLEHVTNKSAFLCGLMKTHRQKEKAHKKTEVSHSSNSSGKDQPINGAGHPGPDEGKLKAILERTGYTLDVTSGQRKFGGPPPNWDSAPPGPGCEVFVGKIPKEIFEDELVPLFEECGRIWDLRLMIDPLNGYNRGYAFITYCTKDEALYAQQKVRTITIEIAHC